LQTFTTLVNFAIRQTSYKPPIYHLRITSNLKRELIGFDAH